MKDEGIGTEAKIGKLSDHRPMWAHYTVSGRRRRTQGLVREGKKAKRNTTHTERQSVGLAIPRHHVREILRSKPRKYGPSGNHLPSIEAELRRSPRGTARQEAQARIQISIQRRLVNRGNSSQSPPTSAHRDQKTCLRTPQATEVDNEQ